MQIMDILSTILLLLSTNCLQCIHSAEYAEGYTAHAGRACWGFDFLGGNQVQDLTGCKAMCDKHPECVGFLFYTYLYQGRNCWPKIACGNLQSVSSSWITYKRNPGRGGCTFDTYPRFALYGHNDHTVGGTGVHVCQQKCLQNVKCLSFDYKSKGNICFISYDSKETAPAFFAENSALTYYQKRCGHDVLQPIPIDILKSSHTGTFIVKDGHCVKKYGPFGPGDTTFDNRDMMFTNITEIGASYRSHIYSIRIRYGTAAMKVLGYNGGTVSTTRLNSGEYITGVEGAFSGYSISKLLFITNQRIIGPFGSDGYAKFSVHGDGKPLLYFSGKAQGYYIKGIAMYFKC